MEPEFLHKCGCIVGMYSCLLHDIELFCTDFVIENLRPNVAVLVVLGLLNDIIIFGGIGKCRGGKVLIGRRER